MLGGRAELCVTTGYSAKTLAGRLAKETIETGDRLEELTTATCPVCATVTDLDAIVVDGDQWVVG